MKKYTQSEIRALEYHVLCGLVDVGHPQVIDLLLEIDERRAAQPSRLRYAALML